MHGLSVAVLDSSVQDLFVLTLIAQDDQLMELRQLVYFEAVVRCGGFTRAAQALHIAQPAISAQIRQLEKELGSALLTRTTRHVALTEAGELFLARVRRVLAELDAARSDVSELTGVLRGRVTLGATPVLGPIDLPAALAGYHACYPDVALTLRTGLIGALLPALDDGDLDVVLGPVHPDLPGRYQAQRLADEQTVLITPPAHRLARHHQMRLADLRDEKFVSLPVGSGLRSLLDAAATAAHFTPQVPFEAADPRGVRDLVSAGLGVALLARSLARAPGPEISAINLDPAPPHPPIGSIRRHDRPLDPAAARFTQHLHRLHAVPEVAPGARPADPSASSLDHCR